MLVGSLAMSAGGSRGGSVVCASDLGPEGLEFEPRRCVYVLFSGKTLNSHSTSLHPGVPANCFGDNPTKCWEETCVGLVSHPGGVEILLVASCNGNRR